MVAANCLTVSEIMKIGQLIWLTDYCVLIDYQIVIRHGNARQGGSYRVMFFEERLILYLNVVLPL